MRIYTRNERHIIRYWLRLVRIASQELDQETIMQRTNRTAPAYRIVQQDGRYRIYDKQGHFRISYPTRQEAETYIAAHTGHHTARTQPADSDMQIIGA